MKVFEVINFIKRERGYVRICFQKLCAFLMGLVDMASTSFSLYYTIKDL